MRLPILYGLPGVGKLTVARGLAQLRGYRVFHNHLVFDAVEALFPFDSPPFVELRDRLWVELLSRAIHERVGDVIFTIARDRTLDADFLAGLVPVLSRAGASVRCVELTCSTEELERRVGSAERAGFGKVSSVDRFRRLCAAGEFPPFAAPHGTITVDTSGLSVQESVGKVDAALDRAFRAARPDSSGP
jgi:hypothetical protein